MIRCAETGEWRPESALTNDTNKYDLMIWKCNWSQVFISNGSSSAGQADRSLADTPESEIWSQ